MRKLLQWALCGALLLPAGLRAQTDFCGVSNTAFQEGERLLFKVYYNMGKVWVPAGEARFGIATEQLNSKKTFHITGDGKTLPSYEWFYKVRDRYETFIDAATMLPLRFVRTVNEGGFKINQLVNFNHGKKQAVSNKGTFTIPGCTQDVLSAIYYARNIDYSRYKPGDKIPFTMFLDDKVYNLHIKYIGKERVETRYGIFNAIKISPLLVEGTIFKGGDQMFIWVSDDKNHLPVRVDSPIVVGSIKVDLMGYDKLRNPLSSLVKKFEQ